MYYLKAIYELLKVVLHRGTDVAAKTQGGHSGASSTSLIAGVAGLKTYIYAVHLTGNNTAASLAEMSISLGTEGGSAFVTKVPAASTVTVSIALSKPISVAAGVGENVSVVTVAPWTGTVQCTLVYRQE